MIRRLLSRLHRREPRDPRLPPLHCTRHGVLWVRPRDLLESEAGREAIRRTAALDAARRVRG